MDDIEDCFVKFFLKQAIEIEPDTIQSVINNGYKTKISLVAMDLTLDLPQIDEISLAQRSLLRKYISALQEHSPFYLEINEDELNKYNEKPNKKRKFETVAPDSEDDDYESTHSSLARFDSGKSGSSLVSPYKHPNKASNSISLRASPLKVRRLSIKYHHADADADTDADADEDDVLMKEEEKNVPETKSTRGRGRVSKKPEVRTLSQIRFEKTKELLATSIVKEETKSQVPAVNGGRKSVVRQSIVPLKAELGHVPTPAELAIRAKIEAKKQATEKKRGRPKKNA